MFKNSKISLFVLVTAFLTLGIHLLSDRLPDSYRSMIIMWSPGIAAIIVSLVHKRSLEEIGWKLNWKWMGLGWFIPVAYSLVAYGIIWLLGLGIVPNPIFLERAQLTTGFESENHLAIILISFFYITIFNLLPAMIMALGEEIGWRGFLVPELAKSNTFLSTALISGGLWAIWHLPGILSGNYGPEATPILFQLFCFIVLVVAGAVILAWIRLESGSIWAVAIFHATHNGVIQVFLERLTSPTELTPYFGGEFGLFIPLLSLGIAAWILFKRTNSQRRKIFLD